MRGDGRRLSRMPRCATGALRPDHLLPGASGLCVSRATLPLMQARLSVIAELSGRSLDDLYRLFRLEDAPTVVAHVGGVPVYDVEQCISWLQPEAKPIQVMQGPGVTPVQPVDLAPRAV